MPIFHAIVSFCRFVSFSIKGLVNVKTDQPLKFLRRTGFINTPKMESLTTDNSVSDVHHTKINGVQSRLNSQFLFSISAKI